jgi:short chain dehydrogenase
VLVNAAGWDRIEPFMDNDDELWQTLTAINLLGPVRVSHAFLRPILDADAEVRIVNIASDAGRVGSSGERVYAASKGGVIALTKSLAREMAPRRINVLPGLDALVRSGMLDPQSHVEHDASVGHTPHRVEVGPTISGLSRSSSAKRSTSSRSAARSRGGRPRDPSSCVVTCIEALISSSASTSVLGGSRKAAVPARPPCRPPSPTAITRPNSGSLTVPTSTSAPGGISPLHDRPGPWLPGVVYTSLELSPAGSDRRFALQAEQNSVDVSGVSRRPTHSFESNRPAYLFGSRDGSVGVIAPIRGHKRQTMRCQQSFGRVVGQPRSIALPPIQTGADQLLGGRWIEVLVAGTLSERSGQPGTPVGRVRKDVRAGLGEAEVRHARAVAGRKLALGGDHAGHDGLALPGGGRRDRLENPVRVATQRIDIEGHQRIDARVSEERADRPRVVARIRANVHHQWVSGLSSGPRDDEAPGCAGIRRQRRDPD